MPITATSLLGFMDSRQYVMGLEPLQVGLDGLDKVIVLRTNVESSK